MENWYPTKLAVRPTGTPETYGFMEGQFRPDEPLHYAEFGVYEGATASGVAERFPYAHLYLFDFADTLERAKARLSKFGDRVSYFANSQRFNDSYNWSLGKSIETKYSASCEAADVNRTHQGVGRQ